MTIEQKIHLSPVIPVVTIDTANGLSNVACAGGLWIAPAPDISDHNFDAIKQRSRDATALRTA